LGKRGSEIAEGANLDALIKKTMYDTWISANGVGLAAPQINQEVAIKICDRTASLMLDEVRKKRGSESLH